MNLNITRFAISQDDTPDWTAVDALIEAISPDEIDMWVDMFLDFPDIEDMINPYDAQDEDHQIVLPDIKERLREDVKVVANAVEKAPMPQLLVAPFQGYNIFMTGGMVDQIGSVCPVHASAQRLEMLGGLVAAGFVALAR